MASQAVKTDDRLSLRAWFDEKPPRVAGSLSLQKLGQEAQAVDAFCNGRPFSMAIGTWGNKSITKWENMVVYADGYLAWISKSGRQVHVKSLTPGHHKQVHNCIVPDRGFAARIVISGTTLAVATTFGLCCIFNNINVFEQRQGLSSTPTNFVFSTTAVPVWGVLVRKKFVAVFHGQKVGVASVNLTIWDAERQVPIHCAIPLHGNTTRERCWDAIISNDGQSVVYFEQLNHPNVGTFHHTSVSLEGIMQSQGSVHCREITGFLYRNHNNITVLSSRARAHNRQITLWTYAQDRSWMNANTGTWKICRICYNTDTQQLEIKEDRIKFSGAVANEQDFFWYKDIVYLINDLGYHEPSVLDLGKQDMKDVPMISPHSFVPKVKALGVKRVYTSDSKILGDETFVIKVCRGYYVAWCFDKSIVMADDVVQYKTMLADEDQKRLSGNNQV